MSRFVNAVRIAVAGGAILCFYKDASFEGWLIYGAFVFLAYMLATGFDAVYDSLAENIPVPPDPRRHDY